MPDGDLICYKYGRILIMHNNVIIRKISLFENIKECCFGRFKLLYRLFRLGIRAAEVINKESIVFSIKNILYEVNVNTGELSNGFNCRKGVRPLIFTSVKNVKGFEDGIYFGGYLGNADKAPVDIYYREDIDKWKTVYTFPKGTINHVHAIVSDSYRNCLWIFTGDFDDAAAIWKVADGFTRVERVVCNNQKYRGCVVFALPEGLLYATDAPFADDYIYLMNPDTFEVKELIRINGSCIYGCQWKDKYVFSSTVEGDGRNMSRMEWLLTRKRGAGIKDGYVHMYSGNLEDGFKEIYKEIKDGMPYYTFQFGVFKFPYGLNNTNTLYFQPVATKKNDLCLMSFND